MQRNALRIVLSLLLLFGLGSAFAVSASAAPAPKPSPSASPSPTVSPTPTSSPSPVGPAPMTGWMSASNFSPDIEPGAYGEAWASCPDGRVAIGGGISNLGRPVEHQQDFVVTHNEIVGSGFHGTAYNVGPATARFYVWASCAFVS